MKIVYKQPGITSDISAARGSVFSELWKLTLSGVIFLVVIFFSISLIVDLIVTRISFETETKIFNTLTLLDFHKKASAKQPDFKKISNILDKLLKTGKASPLPFKIFVIDEESINAFAFPGGSIGVTTGLLEKLKGEIEIAFVVGHELGHFKNRDHLRGLGRSIGLGIVMSMISQNGLGADSFTALVAGVLERKYSQEREKKADQFGIELVYDVYGKVQGTDQLFKILLEEDNKLPEWAHMFSTHPSPKQRIKDLEKWAEENIAIAKK